MLKYFEKKQGLPRRVNTRLQLKWEWNGHCSLSEWMSKCRESLSFRANLAGHCWRHKTKGVWMVMKWNEKWLEWILFHRLTEHTNGLSSRCMAEWELRYKAVLNLLPHSAQANGRTVLWMDRWRRRLRSHENILLHSGQGRSWLTVLKWLSKASWDRKLLLHFGHFARYLEKNFNVC